MIKLTDYQPNWPQEYQTLADDLWRSLGGLAVRIDHIGSTAVPGLAAKDRIDIQIGVRTLTPEVEQSLIEGGYRRIQRILTDHIPWGADPDPMQWQKWFFSPPEEARPANIHVRVVGRQNAIYPLLFRDYLRSHTQPSQAYSRVKLALARLVQDDIEAYYDVKDPVCDLIVAAAQEWADKVGWCI